MECSEQHLSPPSPSHVVQQVAHSQLALTNDVTNQSDLQDTLISSKQEIVLEEQHIQACPPLAHCHWQKEPPYPQQPAWGQQLPLQHYNIVEHSQGTHTMNLLSPEQQGYQREMAVLSQNQHQMDLQQLSVQPHVQSLQWHQSQGKSLSQQKSVQAYYQNHPHTIMQQQKPGKRHKKQRSCPPSLYPYQTFLSQQHHQLQQYGAIQALQQMARQVSYEQPPYRHQNFQPMRKSAQIPDQRSGHSVSGQAVNHIKPNHMIHRDAAQFPSEFQDLWYRSARSLHQNSPPHNLRQSPEETLQHTLPPVVDLTESPGITLPYQINPPESLSRAEDICLTLERTPQLEEGEVGEMQNRLSDVNKRAAEVDNHESDNIDIFMLYQNMDNLNTTHTDHVSIMNAGNSNKHLERTKNTTKSVTALCHSCHVNVREAHFSGHLFFGYLQCCSCRDIIRTCKKFRHMKAKKPFCDKKNRRPHCFTNWLACPITYLKHHINASLILHGIYDNIKGPPTVNNIKLAMWLYMRKLKVLENIFPWTFAIKQCHRFFQNAAEREIKQRQSQYMKKNQTKIVELKEFSLTTAVNSTDMNNPQELPNKRMRKNGNVNERQEHKRCVDKENATTHEPGSMQMEPLVGNIIRVDYRNDILVKGDQSHTQLVHRVHNRRRLFEEEEVCNSEVILQHESSNSKAIIQTGGHPSGVTQTEVTLQYGDHRLATTAQSFSQHSTNAEVFHFLQAPENYNDAALSAPATQNPPYHQNTNNSNITVPCDLLDVAADIEYIVVQDESGCLTVQRRNSSGENETIEEAYPNKKVKEMTVEDSDTREKIFQNLQKAPKKSHSPKPTKKSKKTTDIGIPLPLHDVKDGRYLVVNYPQELCPEECPDCYCRFNHTMISINCVTLLVTLLCGKCNLTIFIVPDEATRNTCSQLQ